jgi:predicted nucleic acid-binding protein
MLGDSFLIDSNILLRWVEPSDPDHRLVKTALHELTRNRTDLCYTGQNVAEFWNACMRPVNRNGFGLTPPETHVRAVQFEAQLRLLPDSVLVHQEWRRMLVDYSISGVQVHDARLVAAMRVHGVKRILTFNARDFRRFEDVEALLPQDVPAGA